MHPQGLPPPICPIDDHMNFCGPTAGVVYTSLVIIHPSQAGGNWQATQPARNSPKMSQQQSEPNHKNLQAKNLESD
uniref:Uncharacterized protein n=1 Tax=Oryza glumipatula TaxID=40148 RepID=A0A0D9YRI6_9ORYZ